MTCSLTHSFSPELLLLSQNITTLTDTISKKKLFQIENVAYYNSWFHDKSTNINFVLYISLYNYFTIYSQNWKCLTLKSLNLAIFWDGESRFCVQPQQMIYPSIIDTLFTSESILCPGMPFQWRLNCGCLGEELATQLSQEICQR